MALDRSERARLQRIRRRLARQDPECERRLRAYSQRLAENAGEAAGPAGGTRSAEREPAPWAGVVFVWAAVVAAAAILVAATAAGV